MTTETTTQPTPPTPYDEALTRYAPVLGMETHVELGTVTAPMAPARRPVGPGWNTMPGCSSVRNVSSIS